MIPVTSTKNSVGRSIGKRDATEPLPCGRAVGARRVLDVLGDGEDAGQEEQRHVADVRPDRHGRDHGQRQVRIGEPLDALAEQRADRAVGRARGSSATAPRSPAVRRSTAARTACGRTRCPAARGPASTAATRPSTSLHGHHDRDEQHRHHQRRRERLIGQHRMPIIQSDIPNRSQQVPAVQAEPEHDQHRQQQEGDHAEQAGSEQRIPQRCRWRSTVLIPGSCPPEGHRVIKAGRRSGPLRCEP